MQVKLLPYKTPVRRIEKTKPLHHDIYMQSSALATTSHIEAEWKVLDGVVNSLRYAAFECRCGVFVHVRALTSRNRLLDNARSVNANHVYHQNVSSKAIAYVDVAGRLTNLAGATL